MKDGYALGIIKRLACMRYWIDLNAARFVQWLKGEPRFRLRGKCDRCGACCETPMVTTNAVFFYLKSVRWIMLTWYRVVNGFEYIGQDRKSHTLIFRCTHLSPETGQCDSYKTRPGMCRDYPRNLLYGTHPDFLDTCTYYAVHKRADKIRRGLESADLSPEEREELERKLNVRE